MRNKMLGWLALFALLSMYIVSSNDTGTHTTSLGIGNAAPTINYVYPVANVDLNPATTTTVYVKYNVTDTNGYATINASECKVYLQKVGETTRSNTTGNCITTNDGGNILSCNCSINFQFYDAAGTWTINTTAKDNSGVSAQNASTTLTVNLLDDILLNDTAVSCGTALQSPSTDNSCEVLKITNRGNQNYGSMNDTAYNLDDDITSTYLINANQFTINTTDSTSGNTLSNGVGVAISNSALARGASSSIDFYMYADVPTGRPADNYNSISNWVVEAII